jgi:hypothetical protein
MYLGHIAGFAFLPVSVILYLNAFGVTKLNSIFGLSIMLIAAIGIILIQIGDIIHSHFTDEHVVLTWIVGAVLMFPAFVYFLSFMVKFPIGVMTSLPIITASFLFVEGLSSFFIGN